MKGKRYGDNPKYITDELLKTEDDYDIVWLLKDEVEEKLPEGVRRVKYTPFSVAYELATAKIWIDSNAKSFGTLKRKNQYFIQTWHGSYGLKKVYGDLKNLGLIDKKTMKNCSVITDLMISNSRQTSEIYRRAFWYNGEILECGSPRNDLFFGENYSYTDKIQEYFSIGNKRIALYAPTFRNDLLTDVFNLDCNRLKDSLEQRFGGEWVILVRLHPNNIQDAEKFIHYDDNIKNATYYSVMQELLFASDILVTDYSSCMFDFVTNGKPCFIYASDIEAYREERDYYFDIFDLPFAVAENNEQMEKNILAFEEDSYSKKLQELFEKVGLCESGEACKQVVDYIERYCKEEE